MPNYFNKSKFLIKPNIRSYFFTLGIRLKFAKLRQIFISALIIHNSDSKCHIRIKTNEFDYIIGGVFSKLTLDDLSR